MPGWSHHLTSLNVLGFVQDDCAFRARPIIAMLVQEKRGARVVSHDLAVRRGRALGASPGGPVGGAHPRVGAGRARALAVHQVAVEDGAVGRRPDRLPVQLQLLLGVTELQRARPLVRRGLLAVRQRDGGRQVDVLLQERVRGLETAETVPLQEGGRTEALAGGRRSVHHL